MRWWSRSPDARWFPGQPGHSQQFEYGWQLAGGQRWDAEALAAEVELTCLRLIPHRTLELDILADDHGAFRFEFPEVADVQIDGSFDLGTTAGGWEVMGTAMLVADRPRDDGRRVYVLELSNALVCFASQPASFRTT